MEKLPPSQRILDTLLDSVKGGTPPFLVDKNGSAPFILLLLRLPEDTHNIYSKEKTGLYQ